MYLKLLCATSLILMSQALYSQTNRALMIGIDKYPSQTGWSSIHGANDVDLMLSFLQQCGYKEADMFFLKNEEATKANIVKLFLKLNSTCQKGDNIYIQISTHGQQMIDNDGDESDGLDEAIIPYDACRRFYKGKYEGENHLRDDELEILLEKTRKKIGANGNITVLLDACHSATGTRWGDEYVRGTSYIFAPDDYDQTKREEGKMQLHLKDEKNVSPITVFSACQEDEQNYEYRQDNNIYYGTLVYAFYTLLNGGNTDISIAQFNQKLEKQIELMHKDKRWNQTPYYESTKPFNTFRIGRNR